MFSDASDVMPRMLIIERGNSLQAEYSNALKGVYEFFSASTIDESLHLISNEGIHGVLLDIASIGREEGFLGTRRIKATNSNGKLPIIALLPEADPALKTDSLLAGCTTFMIMPVSTESLDIVITEVLNLASSYRRLSAGTQA